MRVCPLWPVTATLPGDLIAESNRCDPDPSNTLIFANERGSALARYGVHYLLRRYTACASRLVPTLKVKNLHPHSIRHSTAIALLKAGMDLPRLVSGLDMPALTPRCATLGRIWI
jgi:integrase/recombinase XerD